MVDRTTFAAWNDWIEDTVQPDIYVVASLKLALGNLGEGGKTFVRGSDIAYEATFHKFIKRLSKRVYGRNNYKRHKKLLHSIATLEGDNESCRCHLNIYLKRPYFISFNEFRECVTAEWRLLEWAMPDIFVEQRTGNCVAYGLKEGCERILFA